MQDQRYWAAFQWSEKTMPTWASPQREVSLSFTVPQVFLSAIQVACEDEWTSAWALSDRLGLEFKAY